MPVSVPPLRKMKKCLPKSEHIEKREAYKLGEEEEENRAGPSQKWGDGETNPTPNIV